jgi:hypothetical protein
MSGGRRRLVDGGLALGALGLGVLALVASQGQASIALAVRHPSVDASAVVPMLAFVGALMAGPRSALELARLLRTPRRR